MRVINKTGYDTRKLREVLCAVHSADAKNRGGRYRRWKDLKVEIVAARTGRHSGYAYYNGTYCRLRVPPKKLIVDRFAALWRHELWHLYGIKHADYPPPVLYCYPTQRFIQEVCGNISWITIEEVTPKAKPKPTAEEKDVIKIARLLERKSAWLTKKKRADNALKKIEKSLKYYNRKAAGRDRT